MASLVVIAGIAVPPSNTPRSLSVQPGGTTIAPETGAESQIDRISTLGPVDSTVPSNTDLYPLIIALIVLRVTPAIFDFSTQSQIWLVPRSQAASSNFATAWHAKSR